MQRLLLLAAIFSIFASGIACAAEQAEKNEPAWGLAKHGLVLRLRVNRTSLDVGQLPRCTMEIKNETNRTMLVEKSFSCNGPAVYDEQGELCKHRVEIELPAGHKWGYHVLKPGECVTVEGTPNYEMNKPGGYTLYFSLYPAIFGYPKDSDPNTMIPAGKWEDAVISNKVTVKILKQDPEKNK